jgi:hypothetical protein
VRQNIPDYLKVLKFLTSKEVSINHVMYHNCPHCYHQQSTFGLETLLHEVTNKEKLNVMKFLLKRGADSLVKNLRKRLAIEQTEHKVHTAVIKHLCFLLSSSELHCDSADEH